MKKKNRNVTSNIKIRCWIRSYVGIKDVSIQFERAIIIV